jgi:tetratricopeptide (TPR) repeat protein
MAKLDAEQVQKIARGEIKAAEILDVNADQMAAVLAVGHLLYENGKLAEAQRIFDGLLVLDANNPFLHAMLGSIYQKQQRFQFAYGHYTRAIDVFPQDIASLLNRGEILLRFGKFNEAAADFKAAVDLDPEQKNPYANRARLLSRLALESLQVAQDKGLSGALDAQAKLKSSLTKS